jgi:O-antigen ligase
MNNINQIKSPSFKPISIFHGIMLTAAFAISLFLHDYSDTHYALVNTLIILAGFFSILPFLKKDIALPSSVSTLLILLFWSFIGFNTAISSVPYDSLVAFLIFSAFPLTFFSVLLSPQKQSILKYSSFLIGAAMGILALYALLQHFILGSTYNYRAHLPLLNPNNLAALFNMSLFPAIAFYFYSKKAERKKIALILTGLFFAALLATESRGAFCSFLITFIIASSLTVKDVKKLPKEALQLTLLFLAIIFFFIIFTPSPNFNHHFENILTPLEDKTFFERTIIWTSALKMFSDHLFFGTGFGTFYLYYQSYRMPLGDNSMGYFAHMDSLQFAAEMGIIAPILFYACLTVILIRTIKAFRTAGEDSFLKLKIIAPFLSLLTLALHSHLTFNLYLMCTLIFSGLLLAFWYNATSEALKDGFLKLEPKVKQNLTISFALILSFLIILIGFSSAAGPFYFEKAKKYKQAQNLEAYLSSLSLAEKWAPNSYVKVKTELASYNLLLLPRYKNEFARENLITNTKKLLEEAAALNPAWSHIDYLKGNLFKEAGDKENAVRAWNTSISKMPHSFETNRALFEHYMSQGRVENAVSTINSAILYPRENAADIYYKAALKEGNFLLEVKSRHMLGKIPREE